MNNQLLRLQTFFCVYIIIIIYFAFLSRRQYALISLGTGCTLKKTKKNPKHRKKVYDKL